MTRRFCTLLLVLFCPALLISCANPGIVQLSPDTYILTKQDRAGIFGNMGALKAEVIQEANQFAESRGKVAIPVSANETPPGPGRFPMFEYQFRVVDSSDPEARRTSLKPRPDLTIERTDKVTGEVRTRDTTERKADTYTELLKLDDLRKKGILTEAEFEVQKKKLLERN